MRSIWEEEHKAFRETFHRWLMEEAAPFHDDWEHDGIVPRELWEKAGGNGFLCMNVPTEYGGGGSDDYRYSAIVSGDIAYTGLSGIGFSLHTDIVAPYIMKCCNDEQKERWLPGMSDGSKITAIAMTEPGTGSDLASVATTAIRDGDSYIVNGAKTFITNGINADLVITVAKTDPTQKHTGISLLMIERGMEGFERGRNLDKIGQKAQDTAELFFDNVRVPAENLMGDEGQGFIYLMENLPQERLTVAVQALEGAKAALEMTIDYCKQREAFGRKIGSFQNSRFWLAEMKTELEVSEAFVDRCIERHNEGGLSAEEGAMAKWWLTDMQNRVVDRCVQLHGGYGYMREYPIARAFVDSRVASIYAGTNEIMKEIIGRSMGF